MQISLNDCRVLSSFVDALLHQPLVVPATTNDQIETRLKWLNCLSSSIFFFAFSTTKVQHLNNLQFKTCLICIVLCTTCTRKSSLKWTHNNRYSMTIGVRDRGGSKIRADLSENMLKSRYFITILHKNSGKLSTAPRKTSVPFSYVYDNFYMNVWEL